MITLNLKKNVDSKVLHHHPWIAKNLFDKPNESVNPGEIIEVRDAHNQFVSRGFANSLSFFYYRAVTFDSREKLENKLSFLQERLYDLFIQRLSLGYNRSFRLCFSENDSLPGLIVDRFLSEKNQQAYQVFVVQVTTAGINSYISDPLKVFKNLVDRLAQENRILIPWERSIVVMRNDIKIREKEGLPFGPPQVLNNEQKVDLSTMPILIDHQFLKSEIKMQADLMGGQKTGFFLDQNYNLLRVAEIFTEYVKFFKPQNVRIMDICCHLGQWSAYLGIILKQMGVKTELVLVDISQDALNKAKATMDSYGIHVECRMIDVLDEAFVIEDKSYDLIIVDPPAFAKSKDHVPAAKSAYQKLNLKAYKGIKKYGFVVSCSCSGAISLEDLKDSVNRAQIKAFRSGKIVAQGGHAADHPHLFSFPEGYYLKMITAQVI
ncbi:MAG: class I SAM-dependent rRNA methyltransferase [Bdellovibrionaceae bacterium]|nr:class I SAM-dependent rRNA methyltransferase [Pseudobdellovibrionaceae bacterium]